MLACIIVARAFRVTDRISLSLYSNDLTIMTGLFFLVFTIGHSAYVMIFVRPDRLKEYILNDLRTKYFNNEHLCNMFLVVLLLPIFMSAFTSFKIILPRIQPFSWDSTFGKWNAKIHGGIQPWMLLQPILGRPLKELKNYFGQ